MNLMSHRAENAGFSWIICGGMLRSGSTLQYQIASELIERTGRGIRTTYIPPDGHEVVLGAEPAHGGLSTFKTHQLTPAVQALSNEGRAATLYCYRDLRDVVASQQRKNNLHFSTGDIQMLVEDLLASDTSWRQLPNKYQVMYEQMIGDVNAEVRRIADFLALDCPSSLCASIADSLAYDAQARRIEAVAEGAWVSVNPNNVYDSISLLHKNHLQSGQIGRYVNDLSAEQVLAVESLAGEWLLTNGYAP